MLGSVLALSSADTSTVGAAAIELRHSLHIGNTDIGLLVAVTSLVGAVFSVPFGMLADRARRTWILGIAIVIWAIAMIWGATPPHSRSCSSTGSARGGDRRHRAHGGVAGRRLDPGAGTGKIFGYILTGELAGAGIGFAVTGDIAALSWRAAFIILALPAFFLAYLSSSCRSRPGRAGVLAPEPGYGPAAAAATQPEPQPQPQPSGNPTGTSRPTRSGWPGNAGSHPTGACSKCSPDPDGLRRGDQVVLRVRTNVALIVSGAFGYYFLAGVQTFGVEFVRGQYGVGQVLANFLLLVVGAGAVIGVLAGGPLGDALLRRGRLNGRVMVAAVAAR